jgi:HEXXH motif-containing protein
MPHVPPPRPGRSASPARVARPARDPGGDLPGEAVEVLGRTGSTPALLGLLAERQRARRLLTLRALLDAVAGAPAGALPPGTAERLLRDWRLLEAAERADPAAARAVVDYPHTGAWAERCLRALGRPGQIGRAAAELPHLGALAVAAAARVGLRFTVELPPRDGELRLPTLGGHRPSGTVAAVRVVGEPGRLWLHPLGADEHPAGLPVEVRRGQDGGWRSAAPGWRTLQALRHPDGRPVLIDDVDPYRDEERRTNPYGLDVADRLDGPGHARWRTAWCDARRWLALGDGTRAREVAALLACVVPLAGAPTAQCSATRGEAFGALLSSTPRGGLDLAATLVHELQHAKLLAVSQIAPLHTAGDDPRYFAPWRPDPRPFDGLFQGAYAHLALADFHLRAARVLADPLLRDAAWADHCRCRQQVGAALPQLLGARALTPHGRALAAAMAAHHARLCRHTPPEGHLARATAYVETARMSWRRHRA